MLVKEIIENRIVTITGGEKKKGFQTLDFNQMPSKSKKKKEFKEIDFKKLKKSVPVFNQ